MGLFGNLFGGKPKQDAGKGASAPATKANGAPGAASAKAIDPVCGMEVDIKTAPAKSDYMGKTYYFCAPGCKKSFDQNPAKYLESKPKRMPGHGQHKM